MCQRTLLKQNSLLTTTAALVETNPKHQYLTNQLQDSTAIVLSPGRVRVAVQSETPQQHLQFMMPKDGA